MKYFFFLLFAGSLHASAQKATIKGVISYYFNENFGDKPDIGAKVFLVPFTSEQKFSTIDSFEDMKRIVYQIRDDSEAVAMYTNSAKEMRTVFTKKYYRQDVASRDSMKAILDQNNALLASKVHDMDGFNQLDLRAFSQFMEEVVGDHKQVTTVDGSGNFQFSVGPGKYYVFIQSKGRNALFVTDVSGQVYYSEVEVAAGEDKDLSHEFNVR